MVAPLYPSVQTAEDQEIQSSDLKWASVIVREVVEKDRLEASVYGIEARQVRKDLEQCRWDIVHLCGEKGLLPLIMDRDSKGSMLKNLIYRFINQHRLMSFIQAHLHIFLI